MVGGSGMSCPTSVLPSIECFSLHLFDTNGKEVLRTQPVFTYLFLSYCHVRWDWKPSVSSMLMRSKSHVKMLPLPAPWRGFDK